MDERRVEELIRECQIETERSIDVGDPPFGCVITDAKGVVVVRARNTQNTQCDPTAHAGINALRQLGAATGLRHFPGYVMFDNASSCSMCTSAAIKARIRSFYYGAPPEKRMNPWLPVEDVAVRCTEPILVQGSILESECVRQIERGREHEIRPKGSTPVIPDEERELPILKTHTNH